MWNMDMSHHRIKILNYGTISWKHTESDQLDYRHLTIQNSSQLFIQVAASTGRSQGWQVESSILSHSCRFHPPYLLANSASKPQKPRLTNQYLQVVHPQTSSHIFPRYLQDIPHIPSHPPSRPWSPRFPESHQPRAADGSSCPSSPRAQLEPDRGSFTIPLWKQFIWGR